MADNIACTSHHIAAYGPEELKEITGDYTDVLGRGGYGVVYKGTCKDGKEIAVKVLHERPGDKMDAEFNSELELIRKLVHQNIIQLVGYCYKKENEYNSDRGAALCFEYAPNGSLRKYISDGDDGPDWDTRYGIIKGICEGLRYLHQHPSGCFIYHLDLKPENILISDDMVPKIADFGLSRLYSDHATRITEKNCAVTVRYAPHEFRLKGIRSKSFDIYSLGVLIIEIVGGPETYDKTYDTPKKEIIEHVRKMWRPKLEETRLYQVCTCLEIALRCSDTDRTNRPEISHVIEKLNEVEDMIPPIQKSVYHESKINQASATGKGREKAEGHGKHKQGHVRAEKIHDTIDMGSKSHNKDLAPKSKGFKELQGITNNFSIELGRGASGVVYKGYMDGKEIAVKVLAERQGGYQEHEFAKEIYNLLELRHPHIIQLVGYCYETEKKLNNFTKKFDDIAKLALCFEYASNGSLRNYISDKDLRLGWHTCYKIIKETCEGLHYLHHHPSGSICHLDLKPENILLSENMAPKISGFAMSRLFLNQHTQATVNLLGSWRYQPMEYKKRGIVSRYFDIYSLGVIIIEMVAGPACYDDYDDFSQQEIIDRVLKKWGHTKEKTLSSYQVKKCLEISFRCVENNIIGRPDISEIINELNEVETMIRKEGSVSHESRKDSCPCPEQDTMGDDDEVILYVQTQGGRPRTVRACNTIRGALQSLHINFIEKDLFDRPDYAVEVEQLSEDMPYSPQVPVLSVNGESVGDARELLKLHEDGELAALFQRATLADSSGHPA